MTIARIAGAGFWVAFASTAAIAQPAGGAAPAPAASVIERTYPAGGIMPWRRADTRSESAGRQVVHEVTETPDPDGKFAQTQEVVTESVRTGPNTAQTRRDVFGFAGQREQLLETIQSEQVTGPGANARTVARAWAPDGNGHLRLTFRSVEERSAIAPDAVYTDTTVFQLGMYEALGESTRTEQTERRLAADLVELDTTQFVRDLNGRWQPIEIRSQQFRGSGASQALTEETVRRLDANGNLSLSERSVIRHSDANGLQQVLIETYSNEADGFVHTDGHLGLSLRVRSTTTAGNDFSETVEEVEARNVVAPSDPMRVAVRTVSTARRIGPNRWATERDVFHLDVNGRMSLAVQETGEATY